MPTGCSHKSARTALIATSIGWSWPACPNPAPNARRGSSNWDRMSGICSRLARTRRPQHGCGRRPAGRSWSRCGSSIMRVGEHEVRWRDGPAVSNEQRVVSPYDPEARASRKRETSWVGFKVHLTETCDEQEESVHLITQVTTTPATTHDGHMLAPILYDLRQQDLAPAEHFVDMCYTSGQDLAQQAASDTTVIA